MSPVAVAFPFSPADAAIVALWFLGARRGYRDGFLESAWSAGRWLLIALPGAAASVALASTLAATLRLSPPFAAWTAYLLIAGVVLLILDLAHRRFSQPLAARLPAGPLDPLAGLAGGLVAAAAATLVAFALLHPFHPPRTDWNPADMSGEQAVHALVSTVLGSVRQFVLDDSFLGRLVQIHAPGLLPGHPVLP